MTISGRTLTREEIHLVWTIDRAEVIDRIYCLENGTLVLIPEHFDMRGWPPGETDKYQPILEACWDRGGWFYGLFEDGRLVGTAVLESHLIGKHADQLQLEFLHVSRLYRDRGLGKQLFNLAKEEALKRGARYLYISATPSEHTIRFYLGLGCRVAPEPDPELFELEPKDIHLLCPLAQPLPMEKEEHGSL